MPGALGLLPFTDALGRARWSLVARVWQAVMVNGMRVTTGLRVLRDRDAIAGAPGEVVFFSMESPPEVVPLPAERAGSRCTRCNTELVGGAPSVACPRCRSWYHATDALPCWTTVPDCSVCSRPTHAAYAWTPEIL